MVELEHQELVCRETDFLPRTHPFISAAPGKVPSFGHPIASSWSPYCA